MIDDRVISGYNIENEDDVSLRPATLNEYVGQYAVKDNLKIFIQAALKREESLDHVLLYGPPGLGKTTLVSVKILKYTNGGDAYCLDKIINL